MSRYNDYGLFFGLDIGTGGYFWQEIDEDDEEIAGGDALTLTELLFVLKKNPNFRDSTTKMLVWDGKFMELPSPLQVKIGTMFGKDTIKQLERVKEDLTKYSLTTLFI